MMVMKRVAVVLGFMSSAGLGLTATFYESSGGSWELDVADDLKDGKVFCAAGNDGFCANDVYSLCRGNDALCGFETKNYSITQVQGLAGRVIGSFDIPDGYEVVWIGKHSNFGVKECTVDTDCQDSSLYHHCGEGGVCVENCLVTSLRKTENTDTVTNGPGQYIIDFVTAGYLTRKDTRFKIKKSSDAVTHCDTLAANVYKGDGTSFNLVFDPEFQADPILYAPFFAQPNVIGGGGDQHRPCVAKNPPGAEDVLMLGFSNSIKSFNVPNDTELLIVGEVPTNEPSSTCFTDSDCAANQNKKFCDIFRTNCIDGCTERPVTLKLNSDGVQNGPGQYVVNSTTIGTIAMSAGTRIRPMYFGRVKELVGNITPCLVKHGWLEIGQLKTGYTKLQDTSVVETDEEEYSGFAGARVLMFRLQLLVSKLEEYFTFQGTELIQLNKAKVLAAMGQYDPVRFNEFLSATEFLKSTCPLPPLMTWQLTASCSQECETSLTRGLSNTIVDMKYEDFYQSYANSRGEQLGKEVVTSESFTETESSTETNSNTITDEFSVTTGAEVGFLGFGSASVETGYHRSDSNTHEYSKTYETSKTTETSQSASFGISRDFTEEVAQTQAREFGREVARSEEESCTASCEIEGKITYVFQWVQIQQDRRSNKQAVTKTCHYVCTEDPDGPVCPFSRCANQQCTHCIPGTFKDAKLDQLYSSDPDESGLSGGVIAGIAVGAIVTAVLVATVIWKKKRSKGNTSLTASKENGRDDLPQI